ncbi:GAF domain-containing protein [Marisediminicola senii]|uniref:GAF domain-containing protein n=1 Tax=Marisediminicola senii TaxID=2711233 RepID=UPI0013EC6689|nr:GAF domain-containing protein [Marisediminicola senii]
MDEPRVHAPGPDPDRILILGDGPATGRGVVTYDLALPGALARRLTALTGRGVDIEVRVDSEMTASACIEEIGSMDLSRFDAIIVSVGPVEALRFVPVRRWVLDLTALLDRIDRDRAPGVVTFLLGIPAYAAHRRFPDYLAQATDRRVAKLNSVARAVVAQRRSSAFVPMKRTTSLESADSNRYVDLANLVASHVQRALPAHDPGDARSTGEIPDVKKALMDEPERLKALGALGLTATLQDPVLNTLTRRARDVFGTTMAVVNLIGESRLVSAAVTGYRELDEERSETYCELTIRDSKIFVVEDAATDPRVAHLRNASVRHGVRFYAGYPIEAPSGHRIGAFCVLDVQPREFSDADASILRSLALEAQRRLWQLSQAE